MERKSLGRNKRRAIKSAFRVNARDIVSLETNSRQGFGYVHKSASLATQNNTRPGI